MTQVAIAIRISASRTREQWNTRALELAEARGLVGTARVLAADSYRTVYGVRRSRPIGAEYVVLVTPCDGRATCDCLAGLHGKPCSHAGAALEAERERQVQRTAEREQWEEDNMGGACIDALRGWGRRHR